MTQRRVYDYFDPIPSLDDNETRQYLLTSGVYDGFGFSVDASNNLEIAAGTGLQPDGIMWQETASFSLSFTAPGAATNYTVVATHTDRQLSGGVPVEYAYQTGLVSSVTGGVVLGWIYHPGGGVPLASSHLLPAPKVRDNNQRLVQTAPVELAVPLHGTWSDTSGMGANVVFEGQDETSVLFDATYFVVHQRVSKAAGPVGSETLVQHIQLFTGATVWRPSSFDLYVNIPGSAQIQVELRDTDLNTVTITGSPISTTTNWEWQTITVDRTDGNFTANKPYELRLTHSVGLSQEIKLARVIAHFDPYPS